MDNCPKCNSNWIADEIPERMREYYAGTHWRREIGIDGSMLGVYDGIVALRCPDCGEEFPRGESKWAQELFEKYKEAVEEWAMKFKQE